VDTGVAGGAKSNQKPALMDARTAVMNDELTIGPTGTTAAAVAVKHGITMTRKAPSRMRLAGVAANARAGRVQLSGAASKLKITSGQTTS
jgi:hypothetical protein